MENLTHCKDKMPKIWNKYSQKRNIGASVPISSFMCLWANYIFPRRVCLFCWRKYVDRSWEYINLSQTHECGNWGWGRAIPRKGINKQNCCCSARRIFYQLNFFIFALMVFKFFAALLLKEIKFFVASRKLLTNFNNYFSWPWTYLRKPTYDMYECIMADFFPASNEEYEFVLMKTTLLTDQQWTPWDIQKNN